jgi:hypothetical protein
MRKFPKLEIKDLEENDVLVFTPEIFDKLKKGNTFKVYIIKKIEDENIHCDILEYGNPHFLTDWTEIAEKRLTNYSKFKDIKKNYPQYFI